MPHPFVKPTRSLLLSCALALALLSAGCGSSEKELAAAQALYLETIRATGADYKDPRWDRVEQAYAAIGSSTADAELRALRAQRVAAQKPSRPDTRNCHRNCERSEEYDQCARQCGCAAGTSGMTCYSDVASGQGSDQVLQQARTCLRQGCGQVLAACHARCERPPR
jgi:hypothetical protein